MNKKETNYKYKTWMVTINTLESGYLPSEADLISFFGDICEDFIFQLEKGEEEERTHFQCALKLNHRKRKSTLLKMIEKEFPNGKAAFQVERMHGTWEEAVVYCTKSETSVGIPISTVPLYTGVDVEFLRSRRRRYPWQNSLLDELLLPSESSYKIADDRKIYWITDKTGNTGKSKLTKWMCLHFRNTIKVPFGTSTQMRSAMIDAGPQVTYIIDIPRTLGVDDDMYAVYSLIEDLKNGFIVASMYGKSRKLIMNPPHVVVFSNKDCPVDRLSGDRWLDYYITPAKNLVSGDKYRWNWVSGEKDFE